MSEYKNYEIPVQITEDKIEEYRAFFIKNIDLFERNQAAFYANVELKFNVRIENVKKIQASNTGEVGVENSIIKSEAMLLNDIAMHVNEMINFKNSNENTQRTISNFGFNTPKAIKNAASPSHNLNDDDLAKVKEWHELKNKLKDLIISHLIARYNPELSFNGGMLDELGFKKCRSCYS